MRDAPSMRCEKLKLKEGSQFLDMPPGAVCALAEAIGHELHTVWHVYDPGPGIRTLRLAFIPFGKIESRPLSPDWVHVVTCRDGLGGYITLLELKA